jgi:hypothetical protein
LGRLAVGIGQVGISSRWSGAEHQVSAGSLLPARLAAAGAGRRSTHAGCPGRGGSLAAIRRVASTPTPATWTPCQLDGAVRAAIEVAGGHRPGGDSSRWPGSCRLAAHVRAVSALARAAWHGCRCLIAGAGGLWTPGVPSPARQGAARVYIYTHSKTGEPFRRKPRPQFRRVLLGENQP